MPTSPSKAAAGVLLGMIVLVFTALVGRVGYLQSWGAQRNIARAERQQFQREPLFARRGSIFDRNGLLMAGTVQAQSVFIDPKFMYEQFESEGRSPELAMDQAVGKIARLIDRNSLELSQLLVDKSNSRFVRLADNLDAHTIQEIEKLDLPGVGFAPLNVRYYPMGTIAAHILGGVGSEGDGLEGLELKYDKTLAGRDGSKRTLKDARRRPIYVDAEDYRAPQQGQHLILTIDANIQMIAEEELAAACKEFGAQCGEVVIMDPWTGDVLALGNYPTFNPQAITEATPEHRRNRVLTDPYEPGSTIKPFIVGPALQFGVTKPSDIFDTHGGAWSAGYGGRIIRDVHGYGQLALWDVLVKSSNIGMCQLGQKLGNPGLFKSLSKFQFGNETGIELPAESGGRLNPLAKWNRFTTESISQGYELQVTPLQLARGMCAYANGGQLVTPRVIKGTVDSEGSIISNVNRPAFKSLPQAIDPNSAAQIRRILCDVVVRGTATKARSTTWNIFGKTGTAHIARNGVYSDESYTSSFIGGAPYENPRLVVAVVIHDPDKSKAHYGGTVAAPAAAKIFDRCLNYMQVPPSIDLPLPPQDVQPLLYAYNPRLYQLKSATASNRE